MKGRTPLIADILTLLADGDTGETTVKFAVIINNRTAENFELNRFDTEREAVDYLWLVSQYLRKEARDNADVVKIDGEGRLEELGSVTRRATYARAGGNFDDECWEESDRQRPEESTENYYPEPGEQGFRKGQGLPLRDGEPGDDGPLALPPAPPSETATNRILHRAPGGE